MDLIGREDSSAARTEDAKFETGQGFIVDPAAVAEAEETPGKQQRSRGEERRGNLPIGTKATPKDPRFRETWKLVRRRGQKRRDAGQLANRATGPARGERFGAT